MNHLQSVDKSIQFQITVKAGVSCPNLLSLSSKTKFTRGKTMNTLFFGVSYNKKVVKFAKKVPKIKAFWCLRQRKLIHSL